MSYTLRATIKVLLIALEFILLVIQVWNMTKRDSGADGNQVNSKKSHRLAGRQLSVEN